MRHGRVLGCVWGFLGLSSSSHFLWKFSRVRSRPEWEKTQLGSRDTTQRHWPQTPTPYPIDPAAIYNFLTTYQIRPRKNVYGKIGLKKWGRVISNNLLLRSHKTKFVSFAPLRSGCTKLRHHRMSWIVSKDRVAVFLSYIKAEISVESHVLS